MIKNIVFDMGGVLTGYEAMRVCEHFIMDRQDREQVCTAVFVSPEWLLLDMGVLTDEQALVRMCARLPKRLHEAAGLCLEHWHEHCLWTYPEMKPVVQELKAQGFGIYLCSNASVRMLACYQQALPAVDCFDGILFSGTEKCIKPQREIYERLFDRFKLNPAECYFIDDQQLNIDAGKACGMDGYCFHDGDFEKLKQALFSLK